MVFEILTNHWHQLIHSGDPRTQHLPFVRDPTVAICASISYLIIVTLGPKVMERREPLTIRKILIGYNFFSVVFSVWMMWEFASCSILNPNFNVFCQDLDETDTSPIAMRLVNAHWCYFFSKFIELFDTIFFVVRKKNNQISFLHVYHHVSMVILQWCLIKYVPGGVSYFGPLLNCFIHSLMYAYYMLSAFGPHMQKYLWWKRYLTKMQMIQFTVMIMYLSNALRIGCRWWDAYSYVMLFFIVSLLFLFANFYMKSNSTKKEVKKQE